MKEKIIGILSAQRPEFDFTTSGNFIEDGMIDSFDVVALVSEFEEAFDIEIDGEDIVPENFSSVEAIEELINRSKS